MVEKNLYKMEGGLLENSYCGKRMSKMHEIRSKKYFNSILDLVLLLIDEIIKYLEIAGNIGLCNI